MFEIKVENPEALFQPKGYDFSKPLKAEVSHSGNVSKYANICNSKPSLKRIIQYSYTFPKGCLPDLFELSEDATHLLIAGTTGCGKSNLVDCLMYNLMALNAPHRLELILLDPKRVELSKYRDLPSTCLYACENDSMLRALDCVIKVMEDRYSEMQDAGENQYHGSRIIVIIDELGDLMTTCKRQALPKLQRIAQLGRAAKISLWACTQSPARKIIPSELTINFTDKVAMCCASSIESRQIIGVDGAECLPAHGLVYHRCGNDLSEINVPYMPPEVIKERIDFVVNQFK